MCDGGLATRLDFACPFIWSGRLPACWLEHLYRQELGVPRHGRCQGTPDSHPSP